MSGHPPLDPVASGIVTPEAVVLDLPAAGVATRVLAKLVDLALQAYVLAIGFALMGQVASVTGIDGAASVVAQVIALALVFVVLFVLPVLSEYLWHGRTPGKALVGLRAVSADGGPLGLRQAVVRGLFQLLDVYLLMGIVPAMATMPARRFGDLVAGTFVLMERSAVGATVPVAFDPPPGLEGYVAVLDVSGLDARQYRVVRDYLLRVAELGPGARWHLGVAIAERVAARVRPPAPEGVTPAHFLQCVIAARQLRSGPREAAR